MEKKQINIDLLLPELVGTDDDCVQRIINMVEKKKGVSKVHLLEEPEGGKASLCFHYDPDELQIEELERIAKQAGAEITDKYGHLLVEVEGVRHSRHARSIEENIRHCKGVLFASVSGTGLVRIEYDKDVVSEDELKTLVSRQRLKIVDKSGEKQKTAPDKKEHDDDHHHHHHHLMIFGERTELILAIVTGVLLLTGYLLTLSGVPRIIGISILAVSYVTGGAFAVMEAVDGLRKGHFEIDFLMIVAAIGAAILGRWAEGSFLLFLFSLGHSLEHYAFDKAKRSVAALVGLYPKKALVKKGEKMEEVLVEKLEIGDRIIVRPNSVISADGVVLEGEGSVNEAPITGESMPVDKVPFADNFSNATDIQNIPNIHKVFAGTINGNQPMEIYVSRLTEDSTLSRLIKMVKDAQTQKSKTQQFTDKVERYYVPFVLLLVTLLLFAFVVKEEAFGQSFYRAMAVLIAASPCALAISTPSAVLSGISKAAKGGVLIKGGMPLEILGSINAVAFDKTGTITEGKHSVTGIYSLDKNMEKERFIEIVVATEKLSDHHLAAAIVREGERILGYEVPPAEHLKAYTAKGIEAQFGGETIRIGNRTLIDENGISITGDDQEMLQRFEQQGNTTLIVTANERIIGMLTLQDKPRPEAAKTIEGIKKMGIDKIIMLTGDNDQVGKSIAAEVGISTAMGGLMPEEKVSVIDKWKKEGWKVAMVGDGVNDAPAMAASDVGIAMGAASSPVALETADIALMADNLSRLTYGIQLSRKTKQIIRQNLVISIGMVVILVPLAIGGLSIAPAVIGHEGSTIVVVLNALRLFAFKEK